MLPLWVLTILVQTGVSHVIDLTEENEHLLAETDVFLVNFYADWCRFSRQLHPIFVTTDTAMREAYPDESVVRMGRVDCDSEEKLAQKYRISKYPTIKVFRNGIEMKKEYRGNRSPSDFKKYVEELLKDPVEEFKNLDEAKKIVDNRNRGILVGYFSSSDSTEYKTFSKVAKALSEECSFIAGFGAASEKERVTGDNIMFYDVEHGSAPVSEAVFLGALNNYDLVFKWAHDKCIPLVREITFENGEELTEEGKPFLILFHTNEDTQSLKYFQNEISRSLVGEEENVNFLHANCAQFSHPLQHMGKTVDDCPVIAIDSFKHMYLFPDFSMVHQEGRLLQFVKDLHSGKLHREFHQGPDVTEAIESTTEGIEMAEFIYEIVVVTGLDDSDEDDEDDEDEDYDEDEDEDEDEDDEEDDEEDKNIINGKAIEQKDSVDEDIDEDIPSIPIPSESKSSESLNSVGTKKPPVTKIVKRPNITPAQIRKSIFGEHFKTFKLDGVLEIELDSTVSMEKDSVFKKLKPSKHRYSIRPRDEL